jgi:hypothetical protein
MTDELSSAIAAVKANQYSFCKFISPNDAGVTGGHQAGIYIPKNSSALIFTSPGVKGDNMERFANLTWFDGTTVQCCFKYYGIGTRNEYRITRLGRSFKEGEFVIIVKVSEIVYLGYVLSDEFLVDSFLEELYLTRDDTNALIYLNAEDTPVFIDFEINEFPPPPQTNLFGELTIPTAGVPTFDDLMDPTFQALKELGGEASVKNIEENVAQKLKLSEEDLNEIHRGTRTKLSYRLAWARNYLKRFGIIKSSERGVWRLTPKGENIDSIDKTNVKRTVRKNDDDSEEFETDLVELDVQEEEPLIDIEDIISPFDPKDIKIIVEPKTIDHLVTRLRYDEIDMNTEFQRKGNLWKPEVQSRLIESILLRLPLPPFYFDADDDSKWLVVDGLQRLWSIKNFIVNSELNDPKNPPLELNGLEILTDYSGKDVTYDKLNRAMQRRILETPVTTYLIQPGTPKNVKYNVFRRINTGGLGLNAMEIRNALNQGKPSDFLRDLSEDKDLRTILKLQDKRMEDRELLLRAYSFIEKSYLAYSKPLSGFLDKAMESLSGKSELELEELSNGIIDSIFFQVELFGKHIFSRSILSDKGRPKLNSALFEVWVAEIYKLSEQERCNLLESRTDFISDYKLLLQQDDFNRAVATSTSGKGAVKTRFEGINNIIKKYTA